ncbi:hypothetical protein [Nonomuraea sp. KM88]|uniref:hypothetical protein n=1 Tax=Nonomuraea sp. KM88 TaxID=3457427 RepID=UPI003FCD2EDD
MPHLLVFGEQKIRHITVYALLLAVSAGVAAALVVPDLQVGNAMVTDPQWSEQHIAEWRIQAVLAYTSGSAVGHVCALLAGLLVARWSMTDARQAGFITALLAGSGLGAIQLAVASWAATPLLYELSDFPGTGDPMEDWVVNPGLQHHVPVLVGMALTFAVFLAVAAAGFWMAYRAVLLRFVLVGIIVVVMPIALFFTTAIALIPQP